jgi:putative flippase GtrA
MKRPSLNKNRRHELIKLGEYMVSGGAFFWSGYAMFAVGDKLLGLNLFWAKLLANVTGVTVNFLLERFWVYGGRKLSKQRLGLSAERYLVLTSVNFMIDYLIVRSLKNIGITPYIGQFASAGFFFFWNYLWYRFWVFSKKRRPRRRLA